MQQAAITVICGLIFFSPLIEGGTTHLAVMIIRLMIILLLLIYVAMSIRAGSLSCPRPRAGIPMLLFMVLCILSVTLSPYTQQSLQWLIVLSGYALLVWLVLVFVTSWEQILCLLVLLVAMGIGETVYTIVQAIYLKETRPSGTFFNPNFLAGYLSAIFALVLGMGIYAGRITAGRYKKNHGCAMLGSYWKFAGPGHRTPAWLLAWIATLSLLCTGVLLTGSRGGLIALLMGSSFVLFVRYRWRGLGLAMFGLVLLILIPSPMRDRFQAEHAVNPVSYARWQIWKQAVKAVVDRPLGHGLGLYQYVSPRYAFPVEGEVSRFGKIAQTAHNEYLQIAVEIGVLALVIFLWGQGRLMLEIRGVLRQRLHRWQRSLAVGIAGGIVTIVVHAALDSNLHEPGIAVTLAIGIGLVLAIRRISSSPIDLSIGLTRNMRWVWPACASLLILIATVTVVRAGTAWLYFENGSQAQLNHDLSRAMSFYRSATLLDPGKALYHSALASAYFQKFEASRRIDHAQTAINELHLAIERNPLDGRLFAILGYVYSALGRRSPAGVAGDHEAVRLNTLGLAAYESAKDLEPFSALHRLELGRLHVDLGQRNEAIQEFEHAIELEPNFLPAREALARIYLASGTAPDKRLAMQEYQHIVERQRRYAHVPKDALESRFLAVDATGLAAELQASKIRAS